jgi:protein-tyrosine phosphatase
MNLLFICSRNRWRSRTAEDLFKRLYGYDVRSAGTAESARIKVNQKLLIWADLIFVMEWEHKKRLQEKFPSSIITKEVIVLNIPDEYQYMDNELVELLNDSVLTLLDKKKSKNE